MKIVGFTQLRNELEKGNLENWFNCMLPICEYIYIFDQNSTDGSLEYYKKFDNVVVIESPTNRFTEELICKTELLNKLKSEQQDIDFIMWLDGDEIIDGRLLKNNGEEFKILCTELKGDEFDIYVFGHKNLWRSDVYERIDDSYDLMDHTGAYKLWKYNPNIVLGSSAGLHQSQHPINLTKPKRLPYSLIHRGFATDEQILTKYNVYKGNGQSGWALDRLLNENGLNVREIDRAMLPEWFQVTDEIDPRNKKKLVDLYMSNGTTYKINLG